MTQKMMRLFSNVTEAKSYLQENYDMTIASADQWLDNHITAKNGTKVWVILP